MTAPERFPTIHRKMSFATFERTVPVRPGWKREYYGGKAHVRPSWGMVTFELSVAPRPVTAVPGMRGVHPADAPAILDSFLDAFRTAPEYADYPAAKYREAAEQYVTGFFGKSRGVWSAASTVVVRGSKVVAAALVKARDRGPMLDCLFVRLAYFRRGLATAAAARSVNELADVAPSRLRSHAMLANEPSLAWHRRFGFVEMPSFMVAQSRWLCATHELERQRKFGLLTPEIERRLRAEAEHWRAEHDRLDGLMRTDPEAGFPDID